MNKNAKTIAGVHTHTHTHTCNLNDVWATISRPHQNSILKNNHGSVAIVVIVAMLFILSISLTMYYRAVNRRNESYRQTEIIKAAYEKDVDKMDELYATYMANQEMANLDKQFITEWTVEEGDLSITLPLVSGNYSYNFDVNYGDGTKAKVTSYNDEDRVHTYSDPGTYTVKISGICEGFQFNNDGDKLKITKLVQWGEIGVKAIDFYGCTNLKGKIPSPTENSFENVTRFSRLFYNCSSLSGSVPENLFLNCTNLTECYAIFSGCTGLSGNIPENLFLNCSKVTSFGYAFQYCSSLSGEISEGLFANCTAVTSFLGTFYGCSGLTGSIPEGLFANCPNVTYFRETFRGCSGLSGSIPEGLFANCSDVTTFHRVFHGCSNLTGSIPEGLFANCPNVIGLNGVFNGCSGLTGSIPENLFINCPNNTSFEDTFLNCKGLTGSIPENLFINNLGLSNIYRTFYGCSGLTGSVPKLWDTTKYPNVTSYSGCFRGLTSANITNYADIPADWK